MVLEEYEMFEDSTNRDYPIPNLGMVLCLREAKEIMEGLTPKGVRRLIEIRRDYTHYRDVAIRHGLNEEISRFPKTIHVPKEIAYEIKQVELRNKRITELKQKFGKN